MSRETLGGASLISVSRRSMNRVVRQTVGFLGFGLAVFALGVVCLVRDHYRAALVLAIYPSSFVFYLIPEGVTHRTPEALLFWVGVLSASTFWAVIGSAGLYCCKLARRVAALLAPPN